jgi:hypothetical protein
MVELGCGDYTHPPNIAKKKIKKCKDVCWGRGAPRGNNNILSDLRRTDLSDCSVLNIYNFCFNVAGLENQGVLTGAWHEDRNPGSG